MSVLEIRPKPEIVVLAIAVSMIAFSAQAIASERGEPAPVGTMNGTFHEITLNDPCETVDGLGFSLTTDYDDAAPLFAIQTTLKGKCVWSIASVIHDRMTTIASVTEDLWGVRPAEAADGTYWAALGGDYLHIFSDGLTTRVPPFKRGHSTKSIEAASTGAMYAMEDQGSESKAQSYLVTVSSGSMVSLPVSGWTEALDRGSDGQLYFELFADWRCHIFGLDRFGEPFDRLPCLWQSGRTIAVGQGGGIWAPSLLQVVEYDRSGKEMRSSGLIAPFPNEITNTAALEPRAIVADQQGNVYFEYGKLWRLDKRGRLSTIDLPVKNLHVAAMVETGDGSLWLVESDSNHHGAFYRFTPAAR